MKFNKSLILILFFVLVTGLEFAIAAGGPPGPPTGPAPCWPPPCVIPLDGGISLLVAAGIAYGGKKVYDSRKKNPV